MNRVLKFVVAVVAVMVSLSLVAEASASMARLNHLVRIAEKIYPGAKEHCPNLRIEFVQTIRRDNGTHDAKAADANWDLCRIRLGSEVMPAGRRFACAVLVHEWGHIDRRAAVREHRTPGSDHVDDPNHIMFGGYFAETRVPACNRLEWIEEKIEHLKEHLLTLTDVVRDTSASRRHRRSAKKRRVKVAHRIIRLGIELGP